MNQDELEAMNDLYSQLSLIVYRRPSAFAENGMPGGPLKEDAIAALTKAEPFLKQYWSTR